MVTYLANEGIFSLGTIQQNRLKNNKLPSTKVMKRNFPRGYYPEIVANVDGVNLSAVIWKDNKVVSMLSSYAGALPITGIHRYNTVQKKRIQLDCPHVIKNYNMHMGEVDLLDSFIGRYHTKL